MTHICVFGDNPLSEPMMIYCQLDLMEHISTKLQMFSLKKLLMKLSSSKMATIFSRPPCDTRVTLNAESSIFDLVRDIHPTNVTTKFKKYLKNIFELLRGQAWSYGWTDGWMDGRRQRQYPFDLGRSGKNGHVQLHIARSTGIWT